MDDYRSLPAITDPNRKSNFEIREALTNQRASVIVEKVVGDVRSLRSSYHLESSDSLDLQLRDPYPLLHEISRDNNRSECVHRQNKSAQRGLQHVISKPPDLGVRENTDLTLGSNLSPKSVPETTPTCIVKHSDADISALVNDSSRWLEGITFDLRDQCLTSFEPHWVQLIGQGTQRYFRIQGAHFISVLSVSPTPTSVPLHRSIVHTNFYVGWPWNVICSPLCLAHLINLLDSFISV